MNRPNGPFTPEEELVRAEEYAAEFVGYDEDKRDRLMAQLKEASPRMHGLVKSVFEKMRRQAKGG